MAPINTCLVLLATATMAMAAATGGSGQFRRTLQDGEFSVTGSSGEEYVFQFDDSEVHVIMPESDIVQDETTVIFGPDGAIVSVTVGQDAYSVSYDTDGVSINLEDPSTTRRTQQIQQVQFADRQLQSCEQSCAASINQICGAIGFACRDPTSSLAAILDPFCDDLDYLCDTDGIVTGCERTCAPSCDDDDDCTEPNEICCPAYSICEVPLITGACGDPHMTGFLGQKFDFTGDDGAWYCLVDDGPSMHLNMRVTAPVPTVPEITYITGLSIITTDAQGADHTIEISVTDPDNLDSSCPAGASPCLADGALSVKLDGEESLVSPGEVTLGPGVAVAAVNLPGACRSFGFEKYWERKKLQNAGGGRRLNLVGLMEDMGEWILADPTATNVEECAEHVAAAGTAGLFQHESEHASFQIMTPTGTIRLSHGRLHQIAMRDPTDRFDLPDHLTWQMNVAIDHHDVSLEATGVLGETVVPVVDEQERLVMKGMDAIRGSEEDYRVTGPLETDFTQGHHRQ